MYSYDTPVGQFCIARRGGAWFVEFEGSVFGPFGDPKRAADAVARAALPIPQVSLHPQMAPEQLAQWMRGKRSN